MIYRVEGNIKYFDIQKRILVVFFRGVLKLNVDVLRCENGWIVVGNVLGDWKGNIICIFFLRIWEFKINEVEVIVIYKVIIIFKMREQVWYLKMYVKFDFMNVNE